MEERHHNYKPRPKFFGNGTTFFGLELEVEAPDPQKKRDGLALQENPNWCYAKRDGSLNSNGWEMVTHPISMTSWLSHRNVQDYHTILPGTVLTGKYKGVTYTATALAGGRFEANGVVYNSISAAAKGLTNGKRTTGYTFFGLIQRQDDPTPAFFQLVEQLKQLGYNSHNGGRCGFHVHVSRTAFSDGGDLNNPKFFRFKTIINGSLFRQLSQRTEFTFCQQEPVNERDFWHQNHNRYSAVNITGFTVEIRIFRGNLRETRLRKNLEAIIAAMEFAGESNILIAPTDEEFTAYCQQHRNRFPNLVAFMEMASDASVRGNE